MIEDNAVRNRQRERVGDAGVGGRRLSMEEKKWGRGGEEKQEINAVGSCEQPFNRL